MKLLIKKTLTVATMIGFLSSCGESNKSTTSTDTMVDSTVTVQDTKMQDQTTTASTSPQEIYMLVRENSKIDWLGDRKAGHITTLNIKDGMLDVSNGQVVGGSFVMDMKEVKILNMDRSENKEFWDYFHKENFYEVDKYPTSKFEITKVKPYDATTDAAMIQDKDYTTEAPTHLITGNLTMKDVAKPVTFPAKISFENDNKKLVVESKFIIDRTQWGVNYKPKNKTTLKDNDLLLPQAHVDLKLVTKHSKENPQ